MATKLGRMLTYLEDLLTIKSFKDIVRSFGMFQENHLISFDSS